MSGLSEFHPSRSWKKQRKEKRNIEKDQQLDICGNAKEWG